MPRKTINEFLIYFKKTDRDFDPNLLPARANLDGFLSCPFFASCQIDFLLCLDHALRHLNAFLKSSDFSDREVIVIQNCHKFGKGDVLAFLLSLPPEIAKRFICSVRKYPYL